MDLYTVNGNISYDGPIKDKGIYRLTTHNGVIAMAVPEKVDATLMVRTYNGGFRSTFPIKLGDDQNPHKRFTLTLGSGSAHIELESFGGTILLRRPGETNTVLEREQRKRREGPERVGDKGLDLEASIAEAMREVQPEIDAATHEIDLSIADVMRDVQPEIDTAIHEALDGLHPMVHVAPRPVPRIH